MSEPNWNSKDKRISWLSVFSTLVGTQGAGDNEAKIKGGIAFDIVDELFERQGYSPEPEIDILDHPETAVTHRKNTYPAPALTDDQYDGDETEEAPKTKTERHSTSKENHNSFTGDDGIERFKTVCKTCSAVSWTKTRAYTYCYNHRPTK